MTTHLWDTDDPDDLRHAIQHEQSMQLAFATQLVSLIESSSDDPMMHALAASFRGASLQERRLRNRLKTVVAG